jgi:response regulator RpfG family c-di-GMP phosphodiesterase
MVGKVLLVEDDAALRQAFAIVLRKAGCEVTTASTGTEALDALGPLNPDVIVCDYMLPGVNGLEVLSAARARFRAVEFILVTAYGSLDVTVEALSLGASDLLIKPLEKLEILVHRVQRALDRVRLRREVERASEELRTANARLSTALAELKTRYLATARVVAGMIDLYDPKQGSHAKRVAELATALATAAGLNPELVSEIEIAAHFHDLGYLALPATRARRDPGELRAEELETVQDHPVLGEDLLGGAAAGGSVAQMVRHHHERWDGGGFPDGLAGDHIPLGARVLAVCEAYDEHLTWPPPGTVSSPASAADLLRRGRGRAFDPELADCLLAVTGRRAAEPPRAIEAVPLHKLEEKMVLARPVYTVSGLLLLPEGQVLTAANIARIRNFHRLHPLADRIYVYRTPA